jgi:hypothetical protein
VALMHWQLTLTPLAAPPASGKASKPKKLASASVFRSASAVHLPGSSVIEVALDGSTTVHWQLLGEADFSVHWHAGSSTVMPVCRAPDTASRDRWVRAIASTIMG